MVGFIVAKKVILLNWKTSQAPCFQRWLNEMLYHPNGTVMFWWAWQPHRDLSWDFWKFNNNILCNLPLLFIDLFFNLYKFYFLSQWWYNWFTKQLMFILNNYFLYIWWLRKCRWFFFPLFFFFLVVLCWLLFCTFYVC